MIRIIQDLAITKVKDRKASNMIFQKAKDKDLKEEQLFGKTEYNSTIKMDF